jgi:uncharacterized BrkB/YihY/UPF0761 family membrane protein
MLAFGKQALSLTTCAARYWSSDDGSTTGAALALVIGVLDVLLSLLLVSALFALIFRYMPARRLGLKPMAMGGLLTAVLFDIGRWVVGWYLAHSTQPSAFGAAALSLPCYCGCTTPHKFFYLARNLPRVWAVCGIRIPT